MKGFRLNTKRLFILGCCCLLTFVTQAQSDINLQGYVVTNDNDTIVGEIFDLALETSGGEIRVELPGYQSESFKFKEVKAYKRGSEVYVKRGHTSFKTKDGSFMQVISTGDVVLYRLDYYNAADQMQNDYYVVKHQGTLTKVDRAGFQHSIMPFISDKPEIKEKVEREEWMYDDIALIVTSYNRA